MSTVALTIDYSNGAQKHFGNIPWTKKLTILGAIQAGGQTLPGATIKFGSDRSGRVLGLMIDGLPAKAPEASQWSIWVNAKPFLNATPLTGGARLGTDTSFGFHPEEREANLLKPGDHVVIKLSQATAKAGKPA